MNNEHVFEFSELFFDLTQQKYYLLHEIIYVINLLTR